MTAKEFLRRSRGLGRQIDEAEERLKRMRARMEGGRTANLTGMPSARRDQSDRVLAIIELEDKLRARWVELCALRSEIVDAIQAVPDPLCREVLELYYLDGLTWDDVAERMHYTTRYVQILHGRALMWVSVPEDDHKKSGDCA